MRDMAARPEAATVRADAAGGPSASAARSPVSPITRRALSAAAQLSEARDQVAAVEAAGFPRGALCLMREHVTVLERQQREAMPISAQLDSARATIRKAEQAVEKAEGAFQSAQERLINAETDLGRAYREYDELVEHAQTLPAGATTTPMDTEGQDMGAHFASNESSSSASSSAQTISSGGPTQMQQLQQRFQHLTQTMVRAPEAAAAAADLDDVLKALTQTMVIVLSYLESQEAAQPL